MCHLYIKFQKQNYLAIEDMLKTEVGNDVNFIEITHILL
jgi:hypothetical protein